MKKEYVAPKVEVVQFASEVTLSSISGGDKAIDYGGIDREGSIEPAYRDDMLDVNLDDNARLKDLW